MFQAIITKYIGPTNTRGSKVKARCAGGSVTLHYDYSLYGDDNHHKAAMALCAKMRWDGNSVLGSLAGGTIFDGRMVWVFTGSVNHV